MDCNYYLFLSQQVFSEVIDVLMFSSNIPADSQSVFDGQDNMHNWVN